MLSRKTTVSPAHPVRYWSVMLCSAWFVHRLYTRCTCACVSQIQFYNILYKVLSRASLFWGDATGHVMIFGLKKARDKVHARDLRHLASPSCRAASSRVRVRVRVSLSWVYIVTGEPSVSEDATAFRRLPVTKDGDDASPASSRAVDGHPERSWPGRLSQI